MSVCHCLHCFSWTWPFDWNSVVARCMMKSMKHTLLSVFSTLVKVVTDFDYWEGYWRHHISVEKSWFVKIPSSFTLSNFYCCLICFFSSFFFDLINYQYSLLSLFLKFTLAVGYGEKLFFILLSLSCFKCMSAALLTFLKAERFCADFDLIFLQLNVESSSSSKRSVKQRCN